MDLTPESKQLRRANPNIVKMSTLFLEIQRVIECGQMYYSATAPVGSAECRERPHDSCSSRTSCSSEQTSSAATSEPPEVVAGHSTDTENQDFNLLLKS